MDGLENDEPAEKDEKGVATLQATKKIRKIKK